MTAFHPLFYLQIDGIRRRNCHQPYIDPPCHALSRGPQLLNCCIENRRRSALTFLTTAGHRDPVIDDIIHGPLFSWFSKNICQSVVSGVRDILGICKTHGTFDGVYGFSNGAVMAMLAANIKNDNSLQSAINTQHKIDSGRSSVFRRFAEQRKSISRVSVKTKRAPSNQFSVINMKKSTINDLNFRDK